MSNLSIRTAVEITFGTILEEHPTFSKVLVRSLACIVHHSEKLTEQMFAVPGHDFNKIKLLQEKVLLKELKPLVTLEPTEGVITRATGIPPHVHHSRKLRLILDDIYKIQERQETLQETIVAGVEDVLHKRAMDSDSVSMDRLVSIIDEKFMLTLDALRKEVQKVSNPNNIAGLVNQSENNWGWTEDGEGTAHASDLFLYGGRFNFVPPHFKFPKATIEEGLAFWFKGMIASADGKKKFAPSASSLGRDSHLKLKL
jgi:hypothetical protein